MILYLVLVHYQHWHLCLAKELFSPMCHRLRTTNLFQCIVEWCNVAKLYSVAMLQRKRKPLNMYFWICKILSNCKVGWKGHILIERPRNYINVLGLQCFDLWWIKFTKLPKYENKLQSFSQYFWLPDFNISWKVLDFRMKGGRRTHGLRAPTRR